MKHISKIAGLALSAVAALSMTVPAFASDYSFTTTAPQDYYGSTSYEDVYGSQYNYGGKNVVDYQVPELEYGVQSTTMTGVMERTILPGLQQVVATIDGSGVYGVGGGGGGPITELVESTGSGTGSAVIPSTPQITVPAEPAYTSVQGMAYQDGSIGTLSIPKLSINVKVWEGETTTSMAKGVAHYSSTSGWAGNVGLCGHNRGAKYNIGTIKDLVAGDTIPFSFFNSTMDWTAKSLPAESVAGNPGQLRCYPVSGLYRRPDGTVHFRPHRGGQHHRHQQGQTAEQLAGDELYTHVPGDQRRGQT